ncbi:alpha/beta fold hydrolase [Nocardia sp. NBC_00511]|uniref:alpha/beta fold hydrolase n=1 Tax=Nocardia sp. NBC_00511 TaxID=2903591 RepID=UPI0030E488A2
MTTIGVEVIGGDGGEPILVLPGGGVRSPEYLGDVRVWGVSRPLAVVYYRGTPRTGGLPGPWWDQFDDLEGVRRELGLSSVEVIAHSAGARVALAYAASGAPVRRMALVAPPATWLTGTESDVETLAAARADEPLIVAALAAPPLDLRDEAEYREWLRVTAPLGYARWDAAAERHSATGTTSFEALRAFFMAPIPDALLARIPALTLPVHVIGGAADLLSGRAPVEALAGMFTNGSVELIADCGHYPWIDQPAAYAAALSRWSAAG